MDEKITSLATWQTVPRLLPPTCVTSNTKEVANHFILKHSGFLL
ncbi:MAG: hypothetical protein ACM37W_09295 [Actinomycetota bacterium]